jgi:hypothetical protein
MVAREQRFSITNLTAGTFKKLAYRDKASLFQAPGRLVV